MLIIKGILHLYISPRRHCHRHAIISSTVIFLDQQVVCRISPFTGRVRRNRTGWSEEGRVWKERLCVYLRGLWNEAGSFLQLSFALSLIQTHTHTHRKVKTESWRPSVWEDESFIRTSTDAQGQLNHLNAWRCTWRNTFSWQSSRKDESQMWSLMSQLFLLESIKWEFSCFSDLSLEKEISGIKHMCPVELQKRSVRIMSLCAQIGQSLQPLMTILTHLLLFSFLIILGQETSKIKLILWSRTL